MTGAFLSMNLFLLPWLCQSSCLLKCLPLHGLTLHVSFPQEVVQGSNTPAGQCCPISSCFSRVPHPCHQCAQDPPRCCFSRGRLPPCALVHMTLFTEVCSQTPVRNSTGPLGTDRHVRFPPPCPAHHSATSNRMQPVCTPACGLRLHLPPSKNPRLQEDQTEAPGKHKAESPACSSYFWPWDGGMTELFQLCSFTDDLLLELTGDRPYAQSNFCL